MFAQKIEGLLILGMLTIIIYADRGDDRLPLGARSRILNQQKLKASHSSIIKRRHKEKSYFLNFVFSSIVFFSLIQSVAAYNTDKSYSSRQDVFDDFLNTLSPIFFIFLFKLPKEPESVL